MSATAPGAHYDRVIPAWGSLLGDNLHYGYFESGGESLSAATEALSRRMAARGEIQRGSAVLDIGCGTGAPALLLAREYGCHVTGISTSEVGVAAAQQRAMSTGFGDVARFIVGDGMAMPFEDQTFDRAWVLESSHLMPSKPKLLSECARILRPAGVVVLCDVIRRSPIATSEVIARRNEFLLLRDVFGDAKMETLELYREWAETAGLRVEILEDISSETRPTFDRWRSNANDHKARVVDLIGLESWSAFVESCNVLERLWDEQKLGYGLLRAVKP